MHKPPTTLVTIFLLLCLSSFLSAGELVIASRGQPSAYTIVLADDGGNAHLDHYLALAGKTVQQAIRQATGADLPTVLEKDFSGGPALYIGPTRALKAAGIDVTSFQLWEHLVFARDGSIYLAGNDRPANRELRRVPGSHVYHVLGSLKAALVFCERFANTIFPMVDVVASLPADKIAVPDDCRIRVIPAIRYAIGRHFNAIYDVANNFFPAPWYGNYGGHSHDKAIPTSLYESHPEYFAMFKGKRPAPHATRPQYCLSNPEVQELIYQELLTHADQGYSMVQLNQSDGFRACECPACASLYGVDDFGEKLWIMHRQMAERFLNDRPGVQLCIMAYGPTLKTPKTFRELPTNVVVDLAPFRADVLADWQGMKVPAGFTVYLYNWGYYQLEGFTPKTTAKFLTDQVQSFHDNHILGIYRCGFGELFGLEGPRYFQYGKQLADPTLDADELLKTYCRHTYGQAAATMMAFFSHLDQCLSRNIDRSSDWNDPALFEENGLPSMHDNMRLLALRYPEADISRLDALLTEAERLAPGCWPLELARIEFDYLALTARAVNALQAYRSSKAAADGEAMLSAIVARNDYIAGLPLQKNTDPPRLAIKNGVRLFGYAELSELQDNGRLRAPLWAPLNHDAAWMLANGILPAGRRMKIGAAPQLLVQQSFYRQEPAIAAEPVTVAAEASDDGLKVIFHFMNVDQESVHNDQIQVYFERQGSKRLHFAGRARKGTTSVYERVKTNRENNGSGDVYERAEVAPGVITAPVPGHEGATAMIVIPWATLGGRPEPGETCGFNAFYRKGQLSRIWEHNLYQKTWRNLRDEVGILKF